LYSFEYAAAFFLLGGALKDCVNVCVKYLNDIQLAIVVCRLYEGENGIILTSLLREVRAIDFFFPSYFKKKKNK